MNETEQLKAEIQKLTELNGLKSDLISISAHQLRTSLSALKWILKMFIDKDFGPLTPEQDDLIKKAFSSNERMIAFVNEMLTINHTEDSALKYTYEEVDLMGLIDELIFDFSGETYKKHIEIIFLKNNPVKHIIADKEKIRVVFQNLIENAIKYSNENDKIFISVHEQENGIEVSVKDTGIGIPLEAQATIFQKFFRADNAKVVDSIGSGLGLYTTKNIVEYHGGTIRFESSNTGTTFFVRLPLQPTK